MIYSIDVVIHATAYIRADSGSKARRIAEGMEGGTFELPEGEYGDIVVSGLAFGSDELPDISLSPAMTVGPANADTLDLVG
jgi:hypothetical protein